MARLQISAYGSQVHLDEDGAPYAYFNVVPMADGYAHLLVNHLLFLPADERKMANLKHFLVDHEMIDSIFFAKNSIKNAASHDETTHDMRI